MVAAPLLTKLAISGMRQSSESRAGVNGKVADGPRAVGGQARPFFAARRQKQFFHIAPGNC